MALPKPNSLYGWLVYGAAAVGASLTGYSNMSLGEMASLPFQGIKAAATDPDTSSLAKAWNVVVEGGKLGLGAAAVVGAGIGIALAAPALATAAGAGGLLAVGASTLIATGMLAGGYLASNFVIDPLLDKVKISGDVEGDKEAGTEPVTDRVPELRAPAAYTPITPASIERQPNQDVRLVPAIDPTRQDQTSPDTVYKKFAENFTSAAGVDPADPNVKNLFNHLQQTALQGKDGLAMEPKDLLRVARKAYYGALETGGYLKEPAQAYPDNYQYPLNAKEVVEATTKFQAEQKGASADAPVQTVAASKEPSKTEVRAPATVPV